MPDAHINALISVRVIVDSKHLMTLSKVISVPLTLLMSQRGSVQLNVKLTGDTQWKSAVDVFSFDTVENRAEVNMTKPYTLEALNDVQLEAFVGKVGRQGWRARYVSGVEPVVMPRDEEQALKTAKYSPNRKDEVRNAVMGLPLWQGTFWLAVLSSALMAFSYHQLVTWQSFAAGFIFSVLFFTAMYAFLLKSALWLSGDTFFPKINEKDPR